MFAIFSHSLSLFLVKSLSLSSDLSISCVLWVSLKQSSSQSGSWYHDIMVSSSGRVCTQSPEQVSAESCAGERLHSSPWGVVTQHETYINHSHPVSSRCPTQTIIVYSSTFLENVRACCLISPSRVSAVNLWQASEYNLCTLLSYPIL